MGWWVNGRMGRRKERKKKWQKERKKRVKKKKETFCGGNDINKRMETGLNTYRNTE